MKLVDAGSTWCKIYDSQNDEVSILPTREFLLDDIEIDWGTGHVARRRTSRYENDLVSLAKGANDLGRRRNHDAHRVLRKNQASFLAVHSGAVEQFRHERHLESRGAIYPCNC